MTSNKGIIRRPDFAGGGITAEEKARMDKHASSWISNALRTDTVDRTALTQAVKDLYRVSGREEPIVVIVPSPRIMAFAGGFASAIWYLRKAGHNAATYDATYAATRDATYAATRDATYDGDIFLHTARAILGDHYKLGLACATRWWDLYQGGNMWSAWECYLTAARDILGLSLPSHEAYEAWERCAKNGGFRFVHEKFCMVSDFPERLKLDDRNRSHSDDGPSHRWRDGWSLYHIHGVRVTEQIVMRPGTLTVAQIDSETNTEVRRVMINRYGVERYMRDGGAVIEHQDRCGKLWRKSRAGDTDLVMVEVRNSTPEPDGSIKDYFLRVPPEIMTATAAVAWTFNMKASEYRPALET